jgi:hypothetical protein
MRARAATQGACGMVAMIAVVTLPGLSARREHTYADECGGEGGISVED